MEKLKVQAILSAVITAIGLVLLAYMILVEDEPGGIPLLLIVAGLTGYVVTRVRMRSHREKPPP